VHAKIRRKCQKTGYSGDSQGKPLTVTECGRTTVYHYDLASRAVAQTQPNGLWQYNAYDDLGRLESRQTYTSADALQAQFLWTYDAVGNVTVQSERWPGEGTRGAGWRSTVMVYDATNRLTEWSIELRGLILAKVTLPLPVALPAMRLPANVLMNQNSGQESPTETGKGNAGKSEEIAAAAAGTGGHFVGEATPWAVGATPNSIYTQISGKSGAAIKNVIYDGSGRYVDEVNFCSHGGGMVSGHGHIADSPGDIGSAHLPQNHLLPSQVPSSWPTLPPNIPPTTPLGK
jgi:YD repeat-containing protein